MASTSAPFGMRPANHMSAQIRPSAMTILTGYATTIYQYAPVKIGTDGTIQLAAVNDRFVGIFMGVNYTDANGRPQFFPNWTASTAGTNIVADVTWDPYILYEVQSNAALNLTDIGKQYDLTAASGSATSGLSSQMLDVASSAANAAVRVMNIAPYPNNDWGDTYVIATVMISEHQFVADVAAF